ncbi:hypothetical protein B0A48_09523 [Cryoendolithus antarcticus]|uniref:Uncharacterized protein n=1 Tax=Cryoendolithus antarcticus TaxID=1507870 RepID=A0A1V8T006_9PEZI|nr:hypothetical protein B0A48_09523 [Cryoendolithus antarcticus]
MTTYNSTLGLALLTDAEKDRMVIAFLNNPERNTGVDWDKCILEAKSASVASFKRGIDNSLKKLKAAQYSGETGEGATPRKTLKSTGTKRKGNADAGDGEEDGDGAGEGASPKKTPKATPTKRKGKADAGDGGEKGTPVKNKRGKKVDANSGAKTFLDIV